MEVYDPVALVKHPAARRSVFRSDLCGEEAHAARDVPSMVLELWQLVAGGVGSGEAGLCRQWMPVALSAETGDIHACFRAFQADVGMLSSGHHGDAPQQDGGGGEKLEATNLSVVIRMLLSIACDRGLMNKTVLRMMASRGAHGVVPLEFSGTPSQRTNAMRADWLKNLLARSTEMEAAVSIHPWGMHLSSHLRVFVVDMNSAQRDALATVRRRCRNLFRRIEHAESGKEIEIVFSSFMYNREVTSAINRAPFHRIIYDAMTMYPVESIDPSIPQSTYVAHVAQSLAFASQRAGCPGLARMSTEGAITALEVRVLYGL